MINYCPVCGYQLSPREGNPPQNRTSEVAGSVLDDYLAEESGGVPVAQPKVLDNRKRLMQLRNRPTPVIKPARMDSEMDKFGSLVVGEGLVQEG